MEARDRSGYDPRMDISLSDPTTWIVVLLAPVLIVALRWSLRSRKARRDQRNGSE